MWAVAAGTAGLALLVLLVGSGGRLGVFGGEGVEERMASEVGPTPYPQLSGAELDEVMKRPGRLDLGSVVPVDEGMGDEEDGSSAGVTVGVLAGDARVGDALVEGDAGMWDRDPLGLLNEAGAGLAASGSGRFGGVLTHWLVQEGERVEASVEFAGAFLWPGAVGYRFDKGDGVWGLEWDAVLDGERLYTRDVFGGWSLEEMDESGVSGWLLPVGVEFVLEDFRSLTLGVEGDGERLDYVVSGRVSGGGRLGDALGVGGVAAGGSVWVFRYRIDGDGDGYAGGLVSSRATLMDSSGLPESRVVIEVLGLGEDVAVGVPPLVVPSLVVPSPVVPSLVVPSPVGPSVAGTGSQGFCHEAMSLVVYGRGMSPLEAEEWVRANVADCGIGEWVVGE